MSGGVGTRTYCGLNLAQHMATEQIGGATECVFAGHVRARLSKGTTFIITCEAYQLFSGIQPSFLLKPPTIACIYQGRDLAKSLSSRNPCMNIMMVLSSYKNCGPQVTNKHCALWIPVLQI